MTKKKETQEEVVIPKVETVIVRSRSRQKIELEYGGETYVVLPGKSVEVPKGTIIPKGLGLSIK